MPRRKTLKLSTPADIRRAISRVANMALNNEIDPKRANTLLYACIERVRQIKNRAISNLRRNRKLKEAAEVYGYGCAQAYHWGLGHFKNTGTSATEYLALKHIEQEQSRKNSAKEIRGISTFTQVSSARMKKENGTVPIGLKKLQKTIKQAEALLREADALTKRR